MSHSQPPRTVVRSAPCSPSKTAPSSTLSFYFVPIPPPTPPPSCVVSFVFLTDMAAGGRKHRAVDLPAPTPPARVQRTARQSVNVSGSASGQTGAGAQGARVTASVPPATPLGPSGARVPLFDEEEEDVIQPRLIPDVRGPRATGAADASQTRALPGSHVSGNVQDPTAHGRVGNGWANWLPTVPMLSACWSFFTPRTRAVVKG